MNSKKVKALRREIKYHPSLERKYVMAKQPNSRRSKASLKRRYPGSDLLMRDKIHHDTVELNPASGRFLYQEMKKELKAA